MVQWKYIGMKHYHKFFCDDVRVEITARRNDDKFVTNDVTEMVDMIAAFGFLLFDE